MFPQSLREDVSLLPKCGREQTAYQAIEIASRRAKTQVVDWRLV